MLTVAYSSPAFFLGTFVPLSATTHEHLYKHKCLAKDLLMSQFSNLSNLHTAFDCILLLCWFQNRFKTLPKGIPQILKIGRPFGAPTWMGSDRAKHATFVKVKTRGQNVVNKSLSYAPAEGSASTPTLSRKVHTHTFHTKHKGIHMCSAIQNSATQFNTAQHNAT